MFQLSLKVDFLKRKKKTSRLLIELLLYCCFDALSMQVSKVMAARGIHSLRFNQDQGEPFNFLIGASVFLSYGT